MIKEEPADRVYIPVVPDVESLMKIKETELKLKLAVDRAEKAEGRLIDRDIELKSTHEGSTSVVNEYERIISQMTTEVNNQVEANVYLKEKIKKLET